MRRTIRSLRRIKLGLRSKLFLALLSVTLLGVVATSVPTRLSFVRSFAGYLNEQDIERAQGILPALTAVYEQHGSWDFLRQHPRTWSDILRAAAADFRPTPTIQDPPSPPRLSWIPPIAESGLAGVDQHVTLLDAQRRFVIGNRHVAPNTPMRPIFADGQVVGWLAVVQRVTTLAATHLQRRQLRFAWIIGTGAVLVAALAAVLLTPWLLRPVRRIAAATHRLAAGDYGTRLQTSSHDEIGRLADDFNRLALALEKNERTRRAFMADVSHELRTPLAVLRGELEAIEDGVRKLTQDSVRSLRSEVDTLGKLVNDLYELSLAEVGALTYRMADIDIAESLRVRLRGFLERFAERRIALESDIPEQEVIVNADETRIQQLFGNLVENSLRYTNTGGLLRVSCHYEPSRVVIDLQDSAPGVPPELLPRLFERFFRVEASRNRETGGTGLGLAICKSIVDAHGGTISAQGSPLGGLWIRLTLPVVQ
jgi:two-component system sensor histidine kinase BaeS